MDGGARQRPRSSYKMAFDQRAIEWLNQAVGFAARVGILPLDEGKLGVVGVEYFRRDVPRATAGVLNVEGVENWISRRFWKALSRKAVGRKLMRWPPKASDEAQRNVEPKLGHVVQRQKHGRPSRGLLVNQADMQFARCVDDHQLTPIGIRPLDERLPETAGIEGRGDIEP